MTYNPTTWVSGDVITADKLGNIETGLTNAYVNLQNLDIAFRNLLQIMMKQMGLADGINAWSDTIEDLSKLDLTKSTGFWFDSVSKSFKRSIGIDVTSSGTAISGGDYSTYTSSNAFDGRTDIDWYSSQTGASVSGNAWIGMDFGVLRKITTVKITNTNTASSNIPNSVKVQKWNGAAWVDVITSALSTIAQATTTIDLSAVTSYATKWRVVANANVATSARWTVSEIEMFENEASAVLVWNAQTATGQLTKAAVEAIENLGTGTITYYISRNGGTNYTQCPRGVFTSISTQPTGTTIVCKAVITENAELLATAWGGEL